MKIKKFLVISLLLALVLSLFACGSKPTDTDSTGGGGGLENATDNPIIISPSDRKIKYNVSLSVKTKNLQQTAASLKAKLLEDEWQDSEEYYDTHAYLILRIKTTRLSDFIASIESDYETSNFRLTSEDISNQYVDITTRIVNLEKQHARLLVLYDNANINDLVHISRLLSDIETQIDRLNNQILAFDSLVDYSVVKIYIHGPSVRANPEKYSEILGESFIKGWHATIGLLKFLLRMIVTLTPFLVIVVPVGGAIFGINYLVKIRKAKKIKDIKPKK